MDSILQLLQATHKSSVLIKNLSKGNKIKLLLRLADLLVENQDKIIQENKKDLDKMLDSNPKKDRLLLNKNRIKDLANSLHDIIKLEDPTNKILSDKKLENGLHIQKITVPIGVVGVIYEARPNVTIDVAALCLFAGNAVVLLGISICRI